MSLRVHVLTILTARVCPFARSLSRFNCICPVAHFAGTRKLAFAIRTSKIQGKGAFATRRIPKGARIIEYLGECIDEKESDVRYPDDEMGRHHTFLFSIGDGTRVLDAGPLDWPAKYINHSCAPNCEAIEEEDGRVFISALTNIAEGTELLYDYAYERTPEHTAADEKMYACRCGAATCRGTIMAPMKEKKDKKKSKKEKKLEKQQRKAEREGGVSAENGATDLPAAHAAKKAAKKTGKKAAKKSGEKKSAAKKSGAKKSGAKRSGEKGAAKKGAAKRGGSTKGETKSAKKGARKGGTKHAS